MRAVKETRRYWLPLCAAVLCLFGASLGVPPLVAYVLIMLSFGFCFDAAHGVAGARRRHGRHAASTSSSRPAAPANEDGRRDRKG